VDMTLCMSQSLDNAIALPTCQRQEQKTPRRHENLKRLTAVKDLIKKRVQAVPLRGSIIFVTTAGTPLIKRKTCSNKPSHL